MSDLTNLSEADISKLRTAMWRLGFDSHQFATRIAQKSFRRIDGSPATIGQVNEVLDYAKQCDVLMGRIIELAETTGSPDDPLDGSK